MRFHCIKSYYEYETSLFVQIMMMNIETLLFCKIMRLEGAGGDAHSLDYFLHDIEKLEPNFLVFLLNKLHFTL